MSVVDEIIETCVDNKGMLGVPQCYGCGAYLHKCDTCGNLDGNQYYKPCLCESNEHLLCNCHAISTGENIYSTIRALDDLEDEEMVVITLDSLLEFMLGNNRNLKYTDGFKTFHEYVEDFNQLVKDVKGKKISEETKNKIKEKINELSKMGLSLFTIYTILNKSDVRKEMEEIKMITYVPQLPPLSSLFENKILLEKIQHGIKINGTKLDPVNSLNVALINPDKYETLVEYDNILSLAPPEEDAVSFSILDITVTGVNILVEAGITTVDNAVQFLTSSVRDFKQHAKEGSSYVTGYLVDKVKYGYEILGRLSGNSYLPTNTPAVDTIVYSPAPAPVPAPRNIEDDNDDILELEEEALEDEIEKEEAREDFNRQLNEGNEIGEINYNEDGKINLGNDLPAQGQFGNEVEFVPNNQFIQNSTQPFLTQAEIDEDNEEEDSN